MAGLFPSIANSQNVDVNGQPLEASVLTVYNGGTLVLASCFQDIGLAIPAQNPMTADATGRLPIFYVNDGVYRVRLVDETGVLIYDYPQVASIGASSSGGGGSGVDPTTIFQTGDELFQKVANLVRAGWVRQNAKTIGSATSGATERANNDCQNLFLFLWANYTDAKCPVVGGRGVSAAADWGANKLITLPDMRGRAGFGLDGMGNARANVIPDANVAGGDTGDTADARVGTTTHAVAQANLPAVTLAFTGNPFTPTFTGNARAWPLAGTPQAWPLSLPVPQGGTSVRNDINQIGVVPSNNFQTATVTVTPAGTTTVTPDGSINPVIPSGTIGALGSGVALETISPGALGTWYIKL